MNIRYPIYEGVYRILTIDLYFEDNWGNLQQLTYDFNGKDAEEEDNNTEAA